MCWAHLGVPATRSRALTFHISADGRKQDTLLALGATQLLTEARGSCYQRTTLIWFYKYRVGLGKAGFDLQVHKALSQFHQHHL